MRDNKKIDVTYSILPMIGTTFVNYFVRQGPENSGAA